MVLSNKKMSGMPLFSNINAMENILGNMDFIQRLNQAISDRQHPDNQNSDAWADLARVFRLLSGACQERSNELNLKSYK